MADGSGSDKKGLESVLRPERERPSGLLGVSVAWGYVLALLLAVVPPVFILGDPWGVATDLRVYDEIWVLSGGAIDDGDYFTSARPFGWIPFVLGVLAIVFSYRMRAHRQVMVGSHLGIPGTVKNQVHSFFYGRGLNVIFPYGPADFVTAKALAKNGAEHQASVATAYYYRVFEILAIITFLGLGLILSGWAGVGLPFLYCIVLFFGVSIAVRPLGRFQGPGGILYTLGVAKAFQAFRAIGRDAGLATRLYLMSLGAITLELLGLFFLKNALSIGNMGDGNEYLMLEGVPFAGLVVALAVASLARIIPFTPGGMGVFELSMAVTLTFYGASDTQAVATAMFDGFITNVVLILGMLLAVRAGGMPGILEAWKAYFHHSMARARGEVLSEEEALATS